MEKEEYLINPCEKSSLPFWKTNIIKTNKKIELVNNVLDNKKNKYFFKMIHYLKDIDNVNLDNEYEFVNISIKEYVDHINSCYIDIGVTEEELNNYLKRPTYNKNLWLSIKDKKNNKIVATLIAEFDNDIKEGIIEWVEVSKDYRLKGLGKIIVNELLNRIKNIADFVIVSGDYNNFTKPMFLYKKCGFTNMKIWCISD